ncbi:uncharacterized protein LOC113567446 [Drosophila persimilis]|uniref:uncharacterized protein LOC113567446 n=1 Tax=Drosophila persimilis TaxID=7234 RepID=UPI000F07E7EE|nr:uncharacterized protein LOC113567446 [Drosophila persimilis]
MKFFTVLLFLCAMAGYSFATGTSSTTTEQAFTTAAAPAAVTPGPCGGNQIGGPSGKIVRNAKKLYFFY